MVDKEDTGQKRTGREREREREGEGEVDRRTRKIIVRLSDEMRGLTRWSRASGPGTTQFDLLL